LQTKKKPTIDNITAVESATFESFVVTVPLLGEKDSKECVCDVARRRDKGTKD
jgi:hypothetical protein